MTEALKSCPFCGSSNVKTFGPYGWYKQWGISHSCKSFYSGTSEMIQGFPNEAQAITAWNTRAQPEIITALAEQGRFLIDRLEEFETELLDDEVARQFFGHVTPALARFSDTVAKLENQP
jgi:hypothetical protein